MVSKYYVYIYCDPRNPGKYHYDGLNTCFLFKPIYVGKGQRLRYLDHTKPSHLKLKRPFYYTLKKIIKDGFNPLQYVIINESDVEYNSFLMEKFYIKIIGRNRNGPLLNLTDGGEGVSGYNHSDTTRKKISKANTGIKSNFYGKKPSIETRQKISNSKKGKLRPPDVCHKISNGHSIHKWRITTPEGKIIIIPNLRKFCRDNNLSQSHMCSKDRPKHKGYSCEKL